MQVNGYRGISFSDITLTLDSASHAVRGILSDGACRAIVPTIISSSLDVYDHVLPLLADLADMEEFSQRVLGIHLEGPFISPEDGFVGCHNPSNIIQPSIDLMKHWQKLARGNICMITVAANISGVCDLIQYCSVTNIVVSLGHQNPSSVNIDDAVKAGAKAMTHLGNGLPNLVDRHYNPIWKGLSDDRLTIMLITDGNHLPEDLLRIMFRCKPPHLVVVTSDVAPVAGLPNGKYECFGTSVNVEGTNVRSANLPCLAGSGALMLQCINHVCKLWPLHYAAVDSKIKHADEIMTEIGYINPLRLLDREIIPDFKLNMAQNNILTWVNGKFEFTAGLL